MSATDAAADGDVLTRRDWQRIRAALRAARNHEANELARSQIAWPGWHSIFAGTRKRIHGIEETLRKVSSRPTRNP